MQTCKAKRRRRLAAKHSALTGTTVQSLNGLAAPKVTMAWSAANLTLLTTSNLAAQLLLHLGTKLYRALTTPAKQVPREDPLTWLPAAFVTTAPRRRALALPLWGRERQCVEVHYLGHTFFYQPSERCLLWAIEPGHYLVVSDAAQVPLIAELDPYQPAPSIEATAPVRQLAARPLSVDDLQDFN
ncbi:hypothetical protein HHL22_22150 [Hymenobacter sp. RP-2-7]|uniref:Uncharacterized protein n=1 Tax=Hymenobacter polaris TaxID=2682546 RepID=A0A7Y0AIF4_9BACT|nr:hypothetical protein [Hymenobacter polaris]NML67912.1 hypothetical protein [Hymenobacter polaris]